jgi:sedoheptulokinase
MRGGQYESIQDPGVILGIVLDICGRMCGSFMPVKAIGISCQMHGILYTDGDGNAASPLYTWQDGRGELPAAEGVSHAELLESLSGHCGLATGYGAVTHFYNARNGIVPPGAVGFCSIGDYAAMRLSGRKDRVTHASNAASFGLYDLAKDMFDADAIKKAGMDASFFPVVETGCALFGETLGTLSDANASATESKNEAATAGIDFTIAGRIGAGIPVSLCIGDNQAGFIGSVAKPDDMALINIGTGGQISVAGTKDMGCGGHFHRGMGIEGGGNHPGGIEMGRGGYEVRPLAGDRFLRVGSTLCAGRAYAALERFFASALKMAGAAAEDRLYGAMGALLDNMESVDADGLEVSAQFGGTRADPGLRGSITNIGIHNFTPAHLTRGLLRGIAGELYDLYASMGAAGSRGLLAGAGNGLRKNPHLRKAISERFGLPVAIPKHTEEAAYGSALFALTACGFYGSLAEAQGKIEYE